MRLEPRLQGLRGGTPDSRGGHVPGVRLGRLEDGTRGRPAEAGCRSLGSLGVVVSAPESLRELFLGLFCYRGGLCAALLSHPPAGISPGLNLVDSAARTAERQDPACSRFPNTFVQNFLTHWGHAVTSAMTCPLASS